MRRITCRAPQIEETPPAAATDGARVAALMRRVAGRIIGSKEVGAIGTTDALGDVTFRVSNAPSGVYQTQVTDVSASGRAISDGTTPDNSFPK